MSDLKNVDASISDQARDWVLHLASGDIDVADIDRFKAWIASDEAHARAFEQRRMLWLELGERPELFARQISPPVRPAPGISHRHIRPRRIWGALAAHPRRGAISVSALAASLLVFMAAPEAVLRMKADHRTSANVAEYSLPDGSIAWLDAGSAISVDFDAHERKITLLRGNAFFTVKHGGAKPFRVAALDGVIEDIGTSFEVRRAEDRVDVAVTQGAVRVAPGEADGQGIVLREGQGAGYDSSGAMTTGMASAPNAIAAWRREELMIDRQSLQSVIRQIARYRSGPTWIWADLDARRPVNGALRIGDADAALRDLAAVQGLAITWLPGGIAIVRNSK